MYRVLQKVSFYFQLFTLVALLLVSCQSENAFSNTEIEEDSECLVEVDGEFELLSLDVYPEFLDGGQNGFYRGLYMGLKYPVEARENGIEGMCVLKYEISKTGKVENIVIETEPGGGTGKASVNALESFTNGISFSPGILNGNSVRVKKGLNIRFKLEG